MPDLFSPLQAWNNDNRTGLGETFTPGGFVLFIKLQSRSCAEIADYQTSFLPISPRCLRMDLLMMEVDTAKKCAVSYCVRTLNLVLWNVPTCK